MIFALVMGVMLVPFDPQIIGTLSVLEAVWMFFNGFGAVLSALNWIDANQSLNVAKEPPVDELEMDVARLYRLIQSVIFIIQAGGFVIGVVSSLTPPAQLSEVRELGALIAALMFIGGSALLTWLSWQIGRQRKRIFRQIAEKRVADEHNAATAAEQTATRDAGRDEGRDSVRDPARDLARDTEHDAAAEMPLEGGN